MLREAYDRLDGIGRELTGTQLAVRWAIARAGADSTLLREATSELTPAQLKVCGDRPGLTYTIRLFAEFEVVVRSDWASTRPADQRRRHLQMRTLIDRVAALRQTPPAVVSGTHAVREYRNELAHDRADSRTAMTFDQCKAALGYYLSYLYLSYLPRQW